MSTSAAAQARPWYREYWVWLLMIPPAASVLGGVTMVYLAASEPVALVIEDYARIEEITQERFARDARAAALGLHADLLFEADADGRTRIAVALSGDPGLLHPGSLLLRLHHATNRNADRDLTLARAGTHYVAETDLVEGRYRVELLAPDETWRLGGSLSRVPGTLKLTAQTDAGR